MNKSINTNAINSSIFAIPNIIGDDPLLPDPKLLSYYQNLEERIIWLDTEIDRDCLSIINNIIKFNVEDKDIPVDERKPIKILIYSYGGDGEVALGMISAMAMSKTPIYTYNMGVAMSAGLIIFLGGHKRFCTKYSSALMHSGSGSVGGNFEQTESQMNDYKRFIKTTREYIMERTNIEKKLMDKKKSKEWYIYSQEQLELGIAHSIIDSVDDIIA